MHSTAEDSISSSTIAAGDGREVAAAAAAVTTTASHSRSLAHSLQFVIGQLRRGGALISREIYPEFRSSTSSNYKRLGQAGSCDSGCPPPMMETLRPKAIYG